MVKSSKLFVFLVAGMLLLGGVGCSDSSNDDNQNPPATGPDAGGNDTTSPGIEIPADWEYPSEYSFRFTDFQLDNNSPGSFLNSLLDENIHDQGKKYPIVVLVHFKNIDPANKTLDLRGGAGEKVDLECLPEFDGECEYKWDPKSSPDYTVGSTFDPETGDLNASLDALDFITTFESGSELLKSKIPITNLKLIGKLTPVAYKDAAGNVQVELTIQDAALQGYITEADAKDARVILRPGDPGAILYDVLLVNPLNADLDNDGTKDAWYLTGTFSAKQTTIVP